MEKLQKTIYRINEMSIIVSEIVLFLLMILVTFDVIGRTAFNHPITGTYELSGLALVLIVYFGLGLTQLDKEHIVIEFFTDRMPPRTVAIIETIFHAATIAFLVLTTWQLFMHVERIHAIVTAQLKIPEYPFVIFTAVGVMILILAMISELITSFRKAVGKDGS